MEDEGGNENSGDENGGGRGGDGIRTADTVGRETDEDQKRVEGGKPNEHPERRQQAIDGALESAAHKPVSDAEGRCDGGSGGGGGGGGGGNDRDDNDDVDYGRADDDYEADEPDTAGEAGSREGRSPENRAGERDVTHGRVGGSILAEGTEREDNGIITAAFAQFDLDGDGFLNQAEFKV